MRKSRSRVRLAQLAGFLGVFAVIGAFLAPAPAAAQKQPSLNSAWQSFSLALKAQGEKAAEAAGNVIAGAKQTFAELEGRLSHHVGDLDAALSARKASLETMWEDAAASLDSWQRVAGKSWNVFQRSAATAFDRFADWLRLQSMPEEQGEIRV
jgi:hypothetical protein